MTMTIKEIEEQMLMLQSSLDKLKNPKLQVSRYFAGQYFAPYEGRQYRRMESEGIPIWECFLDIKKEWVQVVGKSESTKLEKIYQQDCVVEETIEEPPEEKTE
jgi:hypothetical protein